MNSRPFSQRRDAKLISIPAPTIDRNDDGTPRRTKQGAPIIRGSGYIPGLQEVFRTYGLRGVFLENFGQLSNTKLSYCALLVFLRLLSWCRWQSAELLYNDSTGELVPDGSNRDFVLAALSRPGTITKSFTRKDLCEAVGVSQRTVLEALKQLTQNELIRPIDVPQQSVTKAGKKAGRPIELLRYEINPEYGYNGPLNDGMGYWESIVEFCPEEEGSARDAPYDEGAEGID